MGEVGFDLVRADDATAAAIVNKALLRSSFINVRFVPELISKRHVFAKNFKLSGISD